MTALPPSPRVAVVDYGMGNLFSIASAARAVGIEPVVTADPGAVAAADGLVLPGVGAFGDAMQRLCEQGLDTAIRDAVARDVPILAVCLGMQLLFDVSEEFGEHRGLGIVPGRVAALRPPGGPRLPKVPHVGWEPVWCPDGRTWEGTPLAVLRPGEPCYFVHSYHCVADDPAAVVAESPFGDRRICAAVRRGSVLGCQFHPERSGSAGLSLYRAMFGGGAAEVAEER